MIGIEKFKEYFSGYENQYVIIGGTACELVMLNEELDFRSTKDLDIVIILESLTKEFGNVFWNFVLEAGYQHINKGTGNSQFYRFSAPISSEYPAMIELFSKKQDWLPLERIEGIVPIHIDDSISSLSAILLNESYYNFLKTGTDIIDGISILKAEHIIPFKAKAWLDLIQRKAKGEHVDSKDIKKHKNDVFRLSVLLTPNQSMVLPDEIKNDMTEFLSNMKDEDVNLKQLNVFGMTKSTVLEMLYLFYNIKEEQHKLNEREVIKALSEI